MVDWERLFGAMQQKGNKAMRTRLCGILRFASWRQWRVGPVLCAVGFVLRCGAGVQAHEIGTTRVSILFQDDQTYVVDIVTDAATLVEKLEASAGETPSADTSPARLQALLAHFEEPLRQRVHLAFDALDVRPVIAYTVASASDALSSAPATITLTGAIPPDARHFTWTYAWTFASYALTVRRAASEPATTVWLEGGQTSAPFAVTSSPPMSRLAIVWRYLTLGVTHIVPHGLDHMLFVLGIYLLSRSARSILWQVSAFTVAHSITLGLSLYGVVAVSPTLVEPLIAVSIAYVAIENIFLAELKSWRVALVFAFGLLHGLGFAGALQALGLPRSEFVTALLTFNIGVEAGQLAVIGAAFLCVGWPCAHRTWYRGRIVVPASTLMAVLAVYWTIQRLFL